MLRHIEGCFSNTKPITVRSGKQMSFAMLKTIQLVESHLETAAGTTLADGYQLNFRPRE